MSTTNELIDKALKAEKSARLDRRKKIIKQMVKDAREGEIKLSDTMIVKISVDKYMSVGDCILLGRELWPKKNTLAIYLRFIPFWIERTLGL